MKNERTNLLIIEVDLDGDKLALIDTIFPRSEILHAKKPVKRIEVTGEFTTVPYVLDEKEYARRMAVVHGKIVNGKVVPGKRRARA